MNLQKGQTLYKHELQKHLGNGQYGQVWLATDKNTNQQIALKILDPKFEPMMSVLQEARVGCQLEHANLCPVHYADVVKINDSNLALIAMEYFPKGSVSRYVNYQRFLPLPMAVQILCDVLRGLEHLHARGIIHNDIKPSNILLDDYHHGILADFGIAGIVENGGHAVPKGNYGPHRAPEVDPDKPVVNVLTDIYQVGVTAYRLLNGLDDLKSAFNQLSAEEYRRQTSKAKIPDRNGYKAFIPKSIRLIVNKAMAPDPAKRFQSAHQMRTRLESCRLNGHWTCDDIANLVGMTHDNEYRFELIPVRGKYPLTCWKKSIKTGREVRVSQFCKKGLVKEEAEQIRDAFILWVVEEAA